MIVSMSTNARTARMGHTPGAECKYLVRLGMKPDIPYLARLCRVRVELSKFTSLLEERLRVSKFVCYMFTVPRRSNPVQRNHRYPLRR